MEDQPTDRSDLTDAADKPAAAGVEKPVPVGKRGGRHRYLRSQSTAATSDATQPGAASVEAPTVEGETPSADTEVSTVAEGTEEVAEPAVKTKRRKWFRRRRAAESVDEATEATEESDDATAERADEESGEDSQDWSAAEPRVRRQAGRRIAIAVAVAAALFVAAGAFGGAMLQPYLADRAVAATKVDIAQTATAAITTLFTYSPEDMDQLSARSSKYLGGDLKEEYTKQVDALAATNKQNQIHRSAQVVGAAVESLNGTNATAMVYANVSYTSAATKDVPKIFLVSYRLSMQRKGSDWVITNMPWITSKDLTRLTP